jgi:hypothetical protein
MEKRIKAGTLSSLTKTGLNKPELQALVDDKISAKLKLF